MAADEPPGTITDEARFRAFVAASSDVVYRMSPDWSQMCELQGRSFLRDTAQPSASWLESYIPVEDRAQVRAAIERAILSKSVFELQHRVVRADGSIGWTSSRAVPLLDAGGEIQEWVGAARDITAAREVADARAAIETRLRESEALRRVALESGRMGAWRWDLARRLVRGDAQFLALWGLEPSDDPLPLSLFTDRMSPEGATEMEVIVTRAIEAGEVFDGPLEIVCGPTAGRWIRWRGRPVGEDPSVLQGVTFDITEQRQAETRLRESEARFRLVADNISQLAWTCNSLGDVNWYNRRWLEYTGLSFEEMGSWGWAKVQHPDHVERVVAGVRRAAASGEPWEDTFPLRRRDGEYRWFYSQAMPIRDQGGEIVQWFGTNTDVTDQQRIEEALRESEARLRQFGEASQDVLWIRDADTFQWTYLTPAFETVYGLGRASALGGDNLAGWLELVVPADRDLALASLERVREGERVSFQYRIRRPSDGQIRWLRDTDFPIRDEAGRVVRIGGIGQDVTALKAAESRQRVLLHELQHRVRNTLAVVRSIASRTGETSETVEDFASHLEGRLNALARTQMVLTRAPGEGIDLESMVREELLAQAAREAQIEIEGQDVRLSPKAAEVLTLAIHELATNAVKYGALATPAGRIRVDWTVEPRDDESWLDLIWEETGVRMVASAPRRQGFGTELIETRVPYELRGRGALRFHPGGLRCEIKFPLRARESILQTRAPEDGSAED